MGVFSWCTSDTKKSIPCCIPFGDLPGSVYLLNPFGEPYKESDYEGYGEFGGRDVYDLVVEWNREYLTSENISKPERSSYEPGEAGDTYFARAMKKYHSVCEAIRDYAAGATDEYMQEKYGKILGYGDGSDWKRCLGIQIACYDKDHVKLKYPIKIVEHPIEYEKAGISPGCPFQGCIYPDSMNEIRREVRKAFVSLSMEEEKWRIQTAHKNSSQLRSEEQLVNIVMNYLGEHFDSSELYRMFHEDMELSNDEIEMLGFDLPQCESFIEKLPVSMKAINIEWDVDCDEDGALLPREIDIPNGMVDEDEISDYLSDITGFCHKGYQLIAVEKESLDSMINSACVRADTSKTGSQMKEKEAELGI